MTRSPGAELLVELLDARGEVHGVADDRVLLALVEPTLPVTAAPAWRPMPMRVGGIVAVRRSGARRAAMIVEGGARPRSCGVAAVGERRAEHGHEAVAEELVDDAVVAR